MIERCETCRFFSALTNECRRKAPVPFPIGIGGGQAQVLGVFPPTKASNWCGEFEKSVQAHVVQGEQPS